MVRTGFILLAASLAVTPAAVATGAHHAAKTSSHAASSSRSGRAAKGSRKGVRRVSVEKHKLHGQQGIAPERATEIQEALIREHYLSGPATGDWDDTTVAAMQKYQSDQGWQTKLMPDSRALQKLGLGADYSNAINAKTGSFGGPISTKTIPAPQASGFTSASGVKQ
jgi:peptidoglycan hydrolase-like protein with peptidoglycan-binding domain